MLIGFAVGIVVCIVAILFNRWVETREYDPRALQSMHKSTDNYRFTDKT